MKLFLMLLALYLPALLAERSAGTEMVSQIHALVQVQVAHARTSITTGNSALSLSLGTNEIDVMSNETSNVIDKIVFIKLHSVGSSTMTSILHHYCEFHHKNCFVNPFYLNPGTTLSKDDLSRIISEFASFGQPALDIWPNHVVMETAMFETLIPGNFMISFFRDPFQRVMSSFRHGKVATVLETMETLKQNIKTATNCGATGLGMAAQITPGQIDALDLVMLTEEYDLSLMMLRRAVGWSMFDMMYRRLKDSHSDDIIAVTSEFAAYLSQPQEDRNAATRDFWAQCMGTDETTVYQYAKKRFQKQWEDLSAEDQQKLLDEKAQFQTTRDQLEECCRSTPDDTYCVALLEDNMEWNHRYQRKGYQYTTVRHGQTPAADVALESSCRTLVKSALSAL